MVLVLSSRKSGRDVRLRTGAGGWSTFQDNPNRQNQSENTLFYYVAHVAAWGRPRRPVLIIKVACPSLPPLRRRGTRELLTNIFQQPLRPRIALRTP
ncbi:hypothetical protein EVAR_48241_1 [Eumeta japonica]|uniref:Uncharacterized protein n=1 Tax=Eumeta variegata TaxID=151549 RepID=A0A4C1YCT3_EUMVA|nr:hypothetical protein EVAR_48241_1 [Eumeta japonica]